MKVSKHQFRDDIFNFVTFDDYHEAIEDALSIYNVDEKEYVVLWISNLTEDDNTDSCVVFEHLGFFKLGLVKDVDIVNQVLLLYENDEE